jgi:hypothetical protein
LVRDLILLYEHTQSLHRSRDFGGALAQTVLSVCAAVAKLLLYVYVVIEFVCGGGVLIWALTLFADDNIPIQFSLGCVGAAGLMLFTAVTFKKGLTDKPCLLNISFLAALIMAVAFLVGGIVLLLASDDVCKKAEEFLIDKGIEETKISVVEESIQGAFTALTDVMLLVGGVAASSVILSLRMKEVLYEEKEAGAQELIAVDAKQVCFPPVPMPLAASSVRPLLRTVC